MEIIKRILRILGIFLALLGIIALFLFSWVDRSPYQEMNYYSQTMDGFSSIDSTNMLSVGDSLRIGWARESLVPEFKVPLAGYGARHGALYEAIHDSIWVKCFLFDNGKTKYAYITMDLLIVPMEVAKQLPDALDTLGIKPENVFLTASHSHCSIGGWGTGIAGELFAGAYNSDIVSFITKSTAKSIYLAAKKLQVSKVGYAEIQASDLVSNRLVGDQKGTIDPWIRTLKFVNSANESALLNVFSAHATCLHHSFHEVSGDYPGELCRNLEKLDNVDFAAFSAGAVGSMAPLVHELRGWPKVEYYAKELSDQVSLTQNFMPVHYDSILGGFNLELYLRDAQFRISENIRVRPWVFEELFGGYPSQITSFRIGDILFVGTPCDFSGELMEKLSSKARDNGLNLVITSFNGGYTGYITKDEWYDLDKYETRVMNWFGPYNGAYFTEIIERIIELHSGQKTAVR